jgi:sulfur carrier protein ThiS
MEIFIERENSTKKLKFEGKVSDLLNKLEINSETVLVAKDNTLVTTEDSLDNNNKIRILSVISGG